MYICTIWQSLLWCKNNYTLKVKPRGLELLLLVSLAVLVCVQSDAWPGMNKHVC